jgi:hypothetical protein
MLRPAVLCLLLAGVFVGQTGWAGSPDIDGATERQLRQRIRTFLQQQQTIRVFVSDGPGYGHQSASASLIGRLRDLGYTGAVEVVYDDSETHESLTMRAKMATLLPGFREDGPPVQHLPGRKMTVYAHSAFARNPEVKQLALGISGADESPRILEDTKTEHLLRLQPARWVESDALRVAGQWIELTELAELSVAYPIAKPEGTCEDFLHEAMSADPKQRKKVPGLANLLGRIERKELLPAYGLGVEGVPKIRKLAKAVLQAQATRPALFGQGVVMPILSNLNAEEVAALALPEGAAVIDVRNPGLSGRLRTLKKGEVLVVTVGSVAKPVFDYLFSISTLPPALAGFNATNLANILGKPFINTMGYIPWLPDKESHHAQAKELTELANREIADERGITVQNLVEFLVQSKQRDSALVRTYRALSPGSSVRRDKFARAVLRLIEVVSLPPNEFKSSPPQAEHSVGFKPPPQKQEADRRAGKPKGPSANNLAVGATANRGLGTSSTTPAAEQQGAFPVDLKVSRGGASAGRREVSRAQGGKVRPLDYRTWIKRWTSKGTTQTWMKTRTPKRMRRSGDNAIYSWARHRRKYIRRTPLIGKPNGQMRPAAP